MTGHPVPLPLQLVQEPALGPYGTQRKLRKSVVGEGCAVEYDGRPPRLLRGFLGGNRFDGQRREKSEKQKGAVQFILHNVHPGG